MSSQRKQKQHCAPKQELPQLPLKDNKVLHVGSVIEYSSLCDSHTKINIQGLGTAQRGLQDS